MKSSLFTMAALSAVVAFARAAALDASSLRVNRVTGGGSISLPLVTTVGSYFAEIAVGTPPQLLKVLIDTGSDDLCIIDSSCRQKCDARAKFNAAASSTYVTKPNQQPTEEVFGAGTAQGRLDKDVVSLGSHKLSSHTFFAITHGPSVVADLAPGSGIMGLGLLNQGSASNGIPEYDAPLLTALARSGAIAAPLFTLQLTRQRYATADLKPGSKAKLLPGGMLTLGAVDGKQYSGPITYTYVGFGDAWIIRLDTIKINGKPISVPSNNAQAAIDSGSPYIIGPKAVVDAIYAQVPGAEKIRGANKYEDSYSLPCDTAARLSLTFGGKEWTLNPTDLVLESLGTVKGGKQQRKGSLTGGVADGEPPSWIIGAPFLSNVFAVFEVGTGKPPPRVGFASPKGSAV